ncbi:MAG: formylglycine-generating enzyme family protein, partial [Blastocatellia bacterium]
PGVPGQKPKKKGNAGKIIGLFGGFFFVIIVAAGGFALWRYKHARANTQIAGPLASPSPVATVEAQVSPVVTPSESPTPTPSLIPEGMVLVPAGTYTIGREGGDLYSSPVHKATLQAFYIDKTEVTNAQYKKFVDATGQKSPDDWAGGEIPAGNDNYPVVGVSWKDASAYAAWADKRLPTEEEWEAAARGPEALIYPWGNDWRPGAANIGTRGIVDVGSFTDGASPFGVLDMIGNVWEWTADEFKTYSGNPAKLPYTLSSGSVYRVIRGGAFDGNKTNDATYRGFLEENKRYPKTGFRCVKTAENPQEGSAPGN